MAQITRVNKSRKEQTCTKCKKVIEVGIPYLKATPFRRATIVRCLECGLKNYETYSSEYKRSVGFIAEDWRKGYDIDENLASNIISDLEEIKDEQEESLDNIPYNLQEGQVGEMLQERIDGLYDVISELESFDFEAIVDEATEEAIEELGKDSKELEERKKELIAEKCGDFIDEALYGLEY